MPKRLGGGYCRLQMPLKPALSSRGQWLSTLEGGVWHKALVVGSVSLWRRLLASCP